MKSVKQQLIEKYLKEKGKPLLPLPQVAVEGKKKPTKEEIREGECLWDYSPPSFKGDIRLSCQHRSRSGELQHRELIILFPTGILEQLGREGKLKGKALGEYVRQTTEEGNSLA